MDGWIFFSFVPIFTSDGYTVLTCCDSFTLYQLDCDTFVSSNSLLTRRFCLLGLLQLQDSR